MKNEWEGREHGRHTHDGINVHARCLHFRQHDNAVMFIFFKTQIALQPQSCGRNVVRHAKPEPDACDSNLCRVEII